MNTSNDRHQAADLMKTFSVYGFFIFCIKRLKMIGVIVFLFLLVGGTYLFFLAENEYEATVRLYVSEFGLAKDYQMIFTTHEVHENAARELGYQLSAEKIGKMVTVVNPVDTRTLTVTVRYSDPNVAAQIANELASAGCNYISDVLHSEEPIIISSAKSVNAPVSPRKGLTMEIAFLLGVLCAFWFEFLMYMADDKVRTTQEIIRITDADMVFVIPKEK